jgi:hypothetical protein
MLRFFIYFWDKYSLSCHEFNKVLYLILAICPGLCIYIWGAAKKKLGDFWSFRMVWPPYFAFTKEFLKNTKENMASDHFFFYFSQEGPIDLIPSPDCCIFTACSIDTHIGHLWCYMALAIWPYGYMAIWPKYGHVAI